MKEKEIHCPCKKTKCERHKDCEACKAHHHALARLPLTTCERIKAKKENKHK